MGSVSLLTQWQSELLVGCLLCLEIDPVSSLTVIYAGSHFYQSQFAGRIMHANSHKHIPVELWLRPQMNCKHTCDTHFQGITDNIYDFWRPFLFKFIPVIFLPIYTRFYPSKWWADRSLHKPMVDGSPHEAVISVVTLLTYVACLCTLFQVNLYKILSVFLEKTYI